MVMVMPAPRSSGEVGVTILVADGVWAMAAPTPVGVPAELTLDADDAVPGITV